MGNEESQMGADGNPIPLGQPLQQPRASFGSPPFPAFPNSTASPRIQPNFMSPNFRMPGPGTTTNSQLGFHHVPRSTAGSSTINRFPVPPVNSVPVLSKLPSALPGTLKVQPVNNVAAPSMDMSGLTEEEQRQIALVMERAAQMMEPKESEPPSRPMFTKPPPAKSSTFTYNKPDFQAPTSKVIPDSKPALVFVKNQNPNAYSKSSDDPFSGLRMPAKTSVPITLSAQTLSSSATDTTAAKAELTNMKTESPSKLLEMPLSLDNPRSLESQGSWSRSVSSECEEPERSQALIQVGDHVQPTQPPRSPLGQIGRSKQAFEFEDLHATRSHGSQVERCPICRDTELKIVTVHGKPQPLIGQLCARCNLIVCSKCGKVKKEEDQKRAYWICSSCIDIPWSPSRGDILPQIDALEIKSGLESQNDYLGQQRASDHHFEEHYYDYSGQTYASQHDPSHTSADPQNQYDVQHDDEYLENSWEPQSQTGQTSGPLFKNFQDEQKAIDSWDVVSNPNTNFWQHENDFRDQRDWSNYRVSETPAVGETLGPEHSYSSQDSLYENQEEETSDYGSQIQAACSDIASLSTSTSGQDLGGNGGQKSWSAPVSSHQLRSGDNSSMSPPDRTNTFTQQESDHVHLRRSNLVQNFRTVPSEAKLLRIPSPDNIRVIPPETRKIISQQKMPEDQTGKTVIDIQPIQPRPNATRQQLTAPVGISSKLQDLPLQHAAPQLDIVRSNISRQPNVLATTTSQSRQQQQQPETTPVAPITRPWSKDRLVRPTAVSTTINAAVVSVNPSSGNCRETVIDTCQGPSSQSGPSYANPPVEIPVSSHNTNTTTTAAATAAGGDRRGVSFLPVMLPVEHHRRFMRQSSREDILTSEGDEFDSALESTNDACPENFDTISQCSQMSATSTATFPLSSSMNGLQKEERRAKRRLPLLPKDDQTGQSISAEERERQAKELKRRLQKLVTSSESNLACANYEPTKDRAVATDTEWPTSGSSPSRLGNKVVKKKRHKHLPLIPQDAPNIQILKQQLRMLAARKAGHEDNTAPYGSLPNNPLNRFKSVSGNNVASSNEYLTDTMVSKAPTSYRSHHVSDPALFRSVLEEYRSRAQLDSGHGERYRRREREPERWNRRDDNFKAFHQHQSDPDIQDLVMKVQQVHREIAETKELFARSASSTLERRCPGRNWKSDLDISAPRRNRDWNEEMGGLPHDYPEQSRFIRVRHPLDQCYQDRPFLGRRYPENNGFPRQINRFDYRDDQDFIGPGEFPEYFAPWDIPQESNMPMRNGFIHPGPIGDFDMHGPRPEPSLLDSNCLENYHSELPRFETYQVLGMDNSDLSMYEPFDDPNHLPMGPGVITQVPASTSTSSMKVKNASSSYSQSLDVPLPDSKVTFSEESAVVQTEVNGVWEDQKENLSDGSEGMDSTEQMSKSMSLKKSKKDDDKPKYNFPTKRILLTRDPKDRSVSGNGLGVRIAGGKLIPNANALGAFVSKIYDNGIVATLGEVKEGDQVLEWNGIDLSNKSYEEVQEILESGNGEVEMLLRCDYNIRDLEAQVEQNRRTSHSRDQSRMRDYDSGERSPLPGGRLMSARKMDLGGRDDGEEQVYRPANQLAPPSPIGLQRKKSTSSGHSPVTGDILLRMTYERCTLTVQVIKARNLKPADKSGFSDPYCKLALVPGRSETKYRTRHIMQTLDPEWKETFTFQSIDPNEIHHKQIEITVWDWDRLSADDFLGEVYIDLADPIHLDGNKRWYTLQERKPGVIEEM